MPKGEYLQYGGQAIIEGVMMRSPNYFSVACRAPNGQIVQQTEHLEKTWIGRQKWLKLPFLRGTLGILDAMALGIRAMRFATKVHMDPAYAKEGEPVDALSNSSKKIQDLAVGGTMVVSLALAWFLFNMLPNILAEQLRFAGVKSGTAINAVTETIKGLFIFGYILLISRYKPIQEVFEYHGAEHKAINTLEADQELTIPNCLKQTRLHPRCGTSFIVVVFIIGFIISTLTPRYLITGGGQGSNILLDILGRQLVELVILTPIIAGVSYELIRLAGKFRNSTLVNLFFKPGLLTQLITTREPNEGQVEVALAALQAVVDAESGAVKAGEEATASHEAAAVIS
ncbi:MAG TPA: DUF1385 domain-containing protein [Fimbriimonadaceae bacterium]|nr:DUF1385 domain-containing protein [Fimbriimonadaceae bacterium]